MLDPFAGSGTVLECALGNGRNYVGYEINERYCLEIEKRLGLFGGCGLIRIAVANLHAAVQERESPTLFGETV